MATLKEMFDYQKFSGNSRLAAMIKDTESRYGAILSEDDLDMVSAAGPAPASLRPYQEAADTEEK